MRKTFKEHGYLWGLLGALALIPLVLSKTVYQPLPAGREGPEAEALVKDIYKAVCLACWEDTGAVYWVFSTAFRGSVQEYRELLWDRDRGFVQVREGATNVQFSLKTEQVLAYRNNMPVVNPAPLVERAYRAFMGDKFWLFPAASLDETGTTRTGALYGDEMALRVDYQNRSFFPGDNYLWFVQVSGLPYGWKMWRADYPVKGLWMTFEKWVTLETGAKVSTFHQGLGNTVTVEKTRGSYDFASLEYESDPFRLLELELGAE